MAEERVCVSRSGSKSRKGLQYRLVNLDTRNVLHSFHVSVTMYMSMYLKVLTFDDGGSCSC